MTLTRAFLILAMAVSLWPLGVILMLSGGGDNASVDHPVQAIRGVGKPSSARPELEEITSRVHELNEDLGKEELYAGEARYDLAYRALDIEEELLGWRRRNRAEASRAEKRVARRLVGLMRATAALTETPSKETLRPYNRALRRFNIAIRGR